MKRPILLFSIACVASVSVANFDVLAARKPLPPLFSFCSHPNFRAAKTSKFATEKLATQAMESEKLLK